MKNVIWFSNPKMEKHTFQSSILGPEERFEYQVLDRLPAAPTAIFSLFSFEDG